MFCTHNEVNLRIALTRRGEVDHVVVRCKECRRHLGTSRPLVDLVKIATRRKVREDRAKKAQE